jgi:hypothetical protein
VGGWVRRRTQIPLQRQKGLNKVSHIIMGSRNLRSTGALFGNSLALRTIDEVVRVPLEVRVGHGTQCEGVDA